MAKRVLVVDDDPTQRRLIQAVLEREGFGVSQADGGDSAIDQLISGVSPDVVILDLVMPGTPGIEVPRAITVPRSITAISSASWSASSKY